MRRLRRLVHRIVSFPARFEEWVDAQDDKAFLAFCDRWTPFVAVSIYAGLIGIVLAGCIRAALFI